MNRIEPVKPVSKYRKPWRTKRNSAMAGVVIVVFSVVAINFAIKALSGSREYLVAAAGAPAGTPLSELATHTISLSLGQGEVEYVQPNFDDKTLVLSQPVSAGELIAKRNLETFDPSQSLVRLAISAKTILPLKLAAGDLIDLWAAVADGSGQFGEPKLIAKNVQVSSTGGGSALFGDSNNRLEVQVSRAEVKPILEAVLHGDAITVLALNEIN